MLVVASETMKAIPECRALQARAVHSARLLPPFNLGEGLISMSAYHFQVRGLWCGSVAGMCVQTLLRLLARF
jgi:hypothetical protein